MGYEGFSKPLPLQRMNPIYGNKNEFFFILAAVILFPIWVKTRKINEDALRAQIKTTNRYAEVPLDGQSKQFAKWSL